MPHHHYRNIFLAEAVPIKNCMGYPLKYYANSRNRYQNQIPASYIVGEYFEDFARECIFPAKHYDLIVRTPRYRDNQRDFQLISLNPDFLFRDKKTKKQFAVECKFRSDLSQDEKFEWTNPKQLQRYREYSKNIPVFVLLGLGEYPDYLELVSLLPLSEAKYYGLYLSVLEEFSIPPFKAFPSEWLWQQL